MEKYIIALKTDANLGKEDFVRSLIYSWCEEMDEHLRPEYYGLGEPIRRSIAEDGVEAVIQTWLTKMRPMLRRKSKPKFIVDINWRKEKGLDPRIFPWGCYVWLDSVAGDTLAIKLFKFLILQFKPVFGSMTFESENREKHFITYKTNVGTVEQFIGIDVGETLPGIYWVTYFGPWSVKKIGRHLFEKVPSAEVETIDGGFLITSYERSKDIGSELARKIEKYLTVHFGPAHFFDKSTVDIEKLKTL